ncbi:hypothetical protein BDZ45DRAFT_685093 [Acephala macrosclerotiorum]|nr:hypothetical protein BDZ45DRAFT_685093 [Acephala macrosclerotiorum]
MACSYVYEGHMSEALEQGFIEERDENAENDATLLRELFGENGDEVREKKDMGDLAACSYPLHSEEKIAYKRDVEALRKGLVGFRSFKKIVVTNQVWRGWQGGKVSYETPVLRSLAGKTDDLLPWPWLCVLIESRLNEWLGTQNWSQLKDFYRRINIVVMELSRCERVIR